MNELIKYAKGMNARKEVIKWIEKRITILYNQTEAEHVIDYLINNPKKLERATYEQMKKQSETWIQKIK